MCQDKVIIGDMCIEGRIIAGTEIYDKTDIYDRVKKMFSLLRRKVPVTPGLVMAIALERGIDYVIADLMALQYGITFLNIDLSFPKERIKYMLRDAEVSAIVCRRNCDIHVEKAKKIIIDQYAEEHISDAVIEKEKNDIAYILYTSGTTGIPKGVEVKREGLYWFIKDASDMVDFSWCKRIAAFTNQTFDINYLEVFMGLLIGLDIVLGDDEDIVNPKKMIGIIKDNNIDTLQLTPSKFKMLQAVDKECLFLKNINVLMLGGEQFPVSLLNEINKKYKGKLYNMYGPTETTIWSTIADLTGKNRVTIGKPLKNTFVYIVDENKKILPPGKTGEIAIGGKGLAKGYKNNTALTNDKFILLNNGLKVYLTGDIGCFNMQGELECMGRKDSQIKINGHRIELDEIDALIIKVEDIDDSLTCFDHKNNQMYTFYCAKDNVNKLDFIKYLERLVPQYMIPSKFIKVDKIKYTASGKSDRNAMLKGLLNLNVYKNTENNILDDIQNQVIKLIMITRRTGDSVGIDTSMAEIGIDSITFVNIIVKVEELYDIEFDDDNMIMDKYQTVNDFIEYIKQKIEVA
ncbi:MAG: AMP-binding protein [Eubacterium sp.]|nr:AMP-binding protein [Eubacterium sp.]